MADTTTTNLSLTKPELDVSTNWGQKLNANLDALDAIFSATGTGVSLNIDGGDIASAVTINKSPVITLGGDLTGNVTLTNLASGTLTATIAGTSVENSMLAGSIANSKLANSSITVSDGSNTTATALGGTITFSGTSNEVEVAESSGTITIGLPAATEITTSLGVGGGSTNGVQISQGAISIKNGGTQSYIDFYCESSNAHYARLQAPAHSAFGGNITLTLPATTGTLALTSGDITGNAATATALATARTIHGVSFDGTASIDLTEVIQDTVGAMVSGNTESNITVTYEDSDGTLDFSVTGGGSVSEAFKTISVSGQSDVVADAAADTLTLVAGSNMTITTNASGDEITFASSGSGGSQNLFSTIAVSGQSNVVADATTDTLTFVAGNNITLTTDASADSITINSTASGGGNASTTQFAKNTFTGDGSTTAFTLTQSMTSEDGLIVFIDGVYQADNVYSVSGTTLTFATAPVNSRIIEVFQLEGGIVGSAPVVDTMTGDGSDTTLTLSVSPISENQTFVTFDGVVQHKSTYSVSSNTLTFATAPVSGVAVECITFTNVTAATDSVVDTFSGTGSQTAFTLSRQPLTENNTLVYVSGIYQDKSTYSVSGTTLTFSTAPANGVSIEVVSAVAAITNSATLLVDADSDTKIQVEESSDEDVVRVDVAGTEVLTLTNSAMTLKGTTPTLTIGDAGAEDTKIVFDGNAQDFYIGLDDSADDLLIGLGSTVGTTPAISIDENVNVELGSALTVDGFSDATGHYISLRSGYSPDESGGSGFQATDHSGSHADGLGVYGHDGISFFTSQSERVRILATSGHVGIGTTAPNADLHVKSPDDSTAAYISGGTYALGIDRDQASGTNYAWYLGTTASNKLVVYDGGGTGRFEVTTSSAGFISDRDQKENITDLSYGLDTVNKLQPKKFKFKDVVEMFEIDGEKRTLQGNYNIGFIAQEMIEEVPEIVSGTDGQGDMKIDYAAFTSVLTKAIQEQQVIIDDLKARITTLEGS